jgi:hypothetical protein
MVMPSLGQTWMFWLNMVPVAIALLFALLYWRRTGSALGLLFLLGGTLTAFNEPIVDALGKCWFAPVDSWIFIKAWGVSVAMFALPVYAWYMGGQAFLAYHVYSKGITMKGMFGLYALGAITNMVLEMPALHFGLYTYFGNQPLVIAKFPVWWTFCNALMPMVMAAVVFRLDSLLQGIRRLLVIPLMWMLGAATNGLVAAPVWVALNSDASLVVTHITALITLGMGILVCYGIGLMVAIDAPIARPRTREPLRGQSGAGPQAQGV